MNTENIARAYCLLEIAEKCSGHSGKLSNLQSWAIGELLALNAQIKAEAKPVPAPAPEPAPEPGGVVGPAGDQQESIHTSDDPELRRL